MAYVPGLENDVFISYGHIDDEAPTKDWVRALHEYVLGKLRIICSKDVTVWRDPRLDGQDYLEPAVRRAVSQSAIFISVLSPGFAQAEWCAREAEWFLAAQSRDGIVVDGKSRVVRAVKSPLFDVPWPQGLGDSTLHFMFYEIDQQSQRVREFSASPAAQTRQQFDDTCDRMTQSIRGVLKRMRRIAKREEPAQPSAVTIFLADVSSDVREHRQSVFAELTDRKYELLSPDIKPDIDYQEWAGPVAAAIERADVAVHILGGRYGIIPEGSEESLVALQFRLVQEKASGRAAERPLRQVVWLPDSVGTLESRQAEFVARLRADVGGPGHREFEFLTSGPQKFKDDLLELASRRKREIEPPGATRSVFLLCHRNDQLDPELQSLRGWFQENGFPADVPPHQGDSTALQQLEEESIIECDATVIFYGTTEDVWVRQKRRAIQKAWAKRAATEQARSRAVYLARPEDDSKQAQYRLLPGGVLKETDRFSPLIVLGDCGPFDPSKLDPLLTWFKRDSGQPGKSS